MRHNKKRNTAFIYEILVKELTRVIIDKADSRKLTIVNILKEHFGTKGELAKELSLYRVLLETQDVEPNIAERLIQETKHAHNRLNTEAIFDAQSKIIAAINKQLGKQVWSNFVPNFKSMASVNSVFNHKVPLKNKVLCEQSVVDKMVSTQEQNKNNNLKNLDSITYRTFVDKFNNKYEPLLKEQKELLNCFITSFVDDGFELKTYLNEELYRLKTELESKRTTIKEDLISEKLSGVLGYLEEFRKREFTDEDLNKLLKTQEAAWELSAND